MSQISSDDDGRFWPRGRSLSGWPPRGLLEQLIKSSVMWSRFACDAVMLTTAVPRRRRVTYQIQTAPCRRASFADSLAVRLCPAAPSRSLMLCIRTRRLAEHVCVDHVAAMERLRMGIARQRLHLVNRSLSPPPPQYHFPAGHPRSDSHRNPLAAPFASTSSPRNSRSASARTPGLVPSPPRMQRAGLTIPPDVFAAQSATFPHQSWSAVSRIAA